MDDLELRCAVVPEDLLYASAAGNGETCRVGVSATSSACVHLTRRE
jgi:hypothetical protein